MCCLFFFFKQKTAYEMRISDWSSDVCSSDLRIFGPKHVQLIARFKPGEIYNADEIYDLRRAIIATGLVSEVEIEPKRGAAQPDGSVLADLDVRMAKAPMRTVAGSVGYDTGQGIRAEKIGREQCRERVCQYV